MSDWLDLSNNANCFKSMYIDGFLDISGGNIQTRGPNDNLIVKGDVSLNGNVYLDKYLSLGVPKYTNTYNYTVTANGPYVFNGEEYTNTNNPVLTFYRGSTYNLTINAGGHPFWIQTTNNGGAYDSTNVYNDGVANNGTQSGVITFIVPYDAPDTLYYRCGNHGNMGNSINIQTFQKYGMDVSGVVDLSGDLYMKSGDISGTNISIVGDCSVNGVFSGIDAKISDATFNNDVIMQNRLFVNTSDLSYNGIVGYPTDISLNSVSTRIGTPHYGTDGEWLGDVMAMSSDATTIVTGYLTDGIVKTFKMSDNSLNLVHTINDGGYNLGEKVAINATGTVMASSDYRFNSNQGRVKIYEWNTNDLSWNIPDVIEGDILITEAYFAMDGLALNSTGNILACSYTNVLNYTGQVSVYEKTGSNWNQKGNNITQNVAGCKGFGYSIDFNEDGTVVVIGTPYYSYHDTSDGAVMVYAWNGTAWVQRGVNLYYDATINYSQYGLFVSINSVGDVISIGGKRNNNKGIVEVYEWSGSTWEKRGNSFSGVNNEYRYRTKLSSDGSMLLIASASSANVHQWDGANWSSVGSTMYSISPYDTQGGDGFHSLAISGNGTIISGSSAGYALPNDNNNGIINYFKIGDEVINYSNPNLVSVNDVDTGGNFSTTNISLNDSLRVPGNITIVDNSANNYGAYITYAQKSGADYFNMGKSPDNVFNIVNQNNIGIYMATGSNSFTGTSDERLKKDIESLENGTDKVMQLKPCSYKWKTQTDEDTEKHVGFIAQEVEEVLPEVVNENEYPDGSKYKGVSITDMIPYLIKMNNELENRLKELEN